MPLLRTTEAQPFATKEVYLLLMKQRQGLVNAPMGPVAFILLSFDSNSRGFVLMGVANVVKVGLWLSLSIAKLAGHLA